MISKSEIELLIATVPGWASDEIKKAVGFLNSRASTIIDDSALERLIVECISNIENILSDSRVRIYIANRTPLCRESNTNIAAAIISHNVNRDCIMRVAKYASNVK